MLASLFVGHDIQKCAMRSHVLDRLGGSSRNMLTTRVSYRVRASNTEDEPWSMISHLRGFGCEQGTPASRTGGHQRFIAPADGCRVGEIEVKNCRL